MNVYDYEAALSALTSEDSDITYLSWLEEQGYVCDDETKRLLLDEDRETERAPYHPLPTTHALLLNSKWPLSLDSLWSLFVAEEELHCRIAIAEAFLESTEFRYACVNEFIDEDSEELDEAITGVEYRIEQFSRMLVCNMLLSGRNRAEIEFLLADTYRGAITRPSQWRQFVAGYFHAFSHSESEEHAHDLMAILNEPSEYFTPEESAEILTVTSIANELWFRPESEDAAHLMRRFREIPSVAKSIAEARKVDGESLPELNEDAPNKAVYALFTMLSIGHMKDVLEGDDREESEDFLEDENVEEPLAPIMSNNRSGYQPPVMKDLGRLLNRQNFADANEAMAFIEQFKTKPIPTIPFDELTEEERIEDMLEEVGRLSYELQAEILRTVVKDHPNVLQGWLQLAQAIPDHHDKLDVIRKGIAIGRSRFIESEDYLHARGHLWSVHEARPFIRLLVMNIDTLHALHRVDEAIDCCEEVLQLNEDDNTGTRHLLQILLLERFRPSDKSRLRELLCVPNMHETFTAWNKCLFLISSKSHKDEIRDAFREALAKNAHVPSVMRDPSRYSEDPNSTRYTHGALDEAMYYVFSAYQAWEKTPGAFAILRSLSR